MRLSSFYLYTIKEEPNDAFLSSHKLMIRSGMIRQAASGIYTWLPYGLLVLNKIKNLICNMHCKSNIHEILMPTIQPADIWVKSGRFHDYGKEMLSSFKNFGKVASDIVSITEFGFEKIQGLTSNEEMADFIQRICDKKT